LKILGFSLTAVGPNFVLRAVGRFDHCGSKVSFLQLFVLTEDRDRLWITADTASLIPGDLDDESAQAPGGPPPM
jgi:hypothetical protein